MVSDYELALMSQAVYSKGGGVVRGWQVKEYFNDSRTGFCAAIYYNEKTNETVVSFRGTDTSHDINMLLNLYTDLRMLLGFFPNTLFQFKEMWIAHAQKQSQLEQFWNFLKTTSKAKLYFTGHSLGGALAELTTHEMLINHQCECAAVTFESPGCANFVSKEHHSVLKEKITCYLSAPNRINTLNPHLGKLYRLYIPHVKDLDLMQMGLCLIASLYRLVFFIALLFLCREKMDLETALPKIILSFGYILMFTFNNCFSFFVKGESSWIHTQHAIDNIVPLFNNDANKPLLRGKIRSWPSFSQYNFFNTAKRCFQNLLPWSEYNYGIRTMFHVNEMLEKQCESTLGYEVVKERLVEKRESCVVM